MFHIFCTMTPLAPRLDSRCRLFHTETRWNASNSTAQQMRQYATLLATPTASLRKHKLTVDVVAACEFLAGRCFPSGIGPTCERNVKWVLDAAWPASHPRSPWEDLDCRRMDVDWGQQKGICSDARPPTHTHTHTPTRTQTAESCSVSVYSF